VVWHCHVKLDEYIDNILGRKSKYIGIGNTEQLPTSINRDTVKCYIIIKSHGDRLRNQRVRVYRITPRREQTMELKRKRPERNNVN